MARFDVTLVPEEVVRVEFREGELLKADFGETYGSAGISDYADIKNKPSINGHELTGGENSLESLGVGRASSANINRLFS